MGKTTLTCLHVDPIVGSIRIGDEESVDTLTEKLFCRFSGAVRIDSENSYPFVPCIPHDHVLAIFAPVGFVSVDEVAMTHLLNEIFVKWSGIAEGSLLESEAARGNEV